ncbi:MAG: hypothetical protein H6755_07910 [Candidatus Omnitrophica bacterium]|nr:hypothetical protein [Candidatus Omnitrophota bacterium]MCB9748317.1 hypothetical protein [Candidatus Omnitrophota bacterium]
MRKLIKYCLGVLLIFSLVQPVAAAQNLKKTVAVFSFENDSGYRNWRTMGQDFSDQLSDALVQSGKFIVLSRKDLDVVMAEQDLANSDRFAKSNTAKVGKIIPAQILVKGKIADFEEDTSSGGQGLKIKGISLGAKKSTANIGVIVQLIDSTTGEILDSKRIDGEAKSGGLSIGYSGSFDINSSNFKKSPVGQATQMAIDRAVAYLAEKMDDFPWKGKVVAVKDGDVFINAGENSGIHVGNSFTVYREGESLIDPDTGIDLGSDKSKIADVKVFEVQEKFSKASLVGSADGEIAAGDLVLDE